MTELFEVGFTFDEIFNTSLHGDEKAHVLSPGLGKESMPVIRGPNKR